MLCSARSLATCLLALTSTLAAADPGYYVVTAYDNEGQRSIDFRYWTVKSPGSPAVLWPEVGIGYGVTSRWYTEVFGSFIGTMDTAFKRSSLNWQNEFLLTQGNLPIDIALHATLIRYPEADEGTTLEYGPVLQTDIGRTQLNLNLFFEHTWGGYASAHTQMKYQWQAKYRWTPALQFGAQGFGELGDWAKWAPRDEQSHRIGPALFGRWDLGQGRALLYQAAWLVGSTYGQNGNMFSMRAQYAF